MIYPGVVPMHTTKILWNIFNVNGNVTYDITWGYDYREWIWNHHHIRYGWITTYFVPPPVLRQIWSMERIVITWPLRVVIPCSNHNILRIIKFVIYGNWLIIIIVSISCWINYRSWWNPHPMPHILRTRYGDIQWDSRHHRPIRDWHTMNITCTIIYDLPLPYDTSIVKIPMPKRRNYIILQALRYTPCLLHMIYKMVVPVTECGVKWTEEWLKKRRRRKKKKKKQVTMRMMRMNQKRMEMTIKGRIFRQMM